ncbi:aea49c4c-1e40-4d78-bc8a-a0bbec01bacc [Thermothielavioides terrestris]|nr:aea49c4c-1e40-4d78-bc8a-a0bbec01bacc [Thermothielavioides terrestris]
MQEDDDGWGDFEVAQDSSPAQPAAAASASTSTNPAQPRTRVIRASTLDLLSNRLLDLSPDTSAPEPWQQRPSWETNTRTQPPPKPAKPARHPDPNVLFDADFETENGTNGDDADEFGDFVSGTPASRAPETAPAASALDLLSLDSAPAAPKKQPPGLLLSNAAFKANPSSYPEAPKSPYGSFQERKPEPVKQLQVSPPKVTKVLEESNQASPSPVTAWPTVEHDGFGGKWEEFKDLPETSSQPAAAAKPLSKLKPNSASTSARATASDWDWQDWGGTEAAPSTEQTTAQRPPTSRPTITATEEDKPGPPPTNIPPPAILLSLFPQLLDLASASLLKPLLTLSPSSPAYQRVLASEATLTFLRGYLALATVAARLIAGRKLRWHRDKFLAQGMSISAASPAAAGQRGMKLASVDKSQAAREDREAAEVAQLWKAQVGRLRAVVAGVNAAHAREGGSGSGPGLRVPEIAVGLAVSTAKGVPTAPKACVVCGLKRDERVAKVDVQVEDSFGEWWVDFWGHRECRNFWLRHERELRQR